MQEWKKIVSRLQLEPHIEGGYFKEIYRSTGVIETAYGDRNLSASIYYLLKEDDFSRFHRIKSDEIWHYYSGNTDIIIHILHPDKTYQELSLNLNNPFVLVKANCWFAASLKAKIGTYALAGCTTSPAFDYRDFEIANRGALLNEFAAHKSIIEKLT